MNLAERKARLEKELEIINLVMKDCKHDYGEPYYDPEIVKVYSSNKQAQNELDICIGEEGYVKLIRDRWSITCRKCGRKIYATNTNSE